MLIFPVFVGVTMLILFIVYIKEDSIMFNLSKGDDSNALKLIEKIYDLSPANG